jgi:dynein heavy chain
MLQNVHLMPAFLYEFIKKMDAFAVEGSHMTFRVFLTSDPTDSIPIELL